MKQRKRTPVKTGKMTVQDSKTASTAKSENGASLSPKTKDHATFIWQGFRHDWEHVPHRMGDFANYIKGDDATIIGVTPPKQTLNIESTAHCTFKPGRDGDEGSCRTYYRPIYQNNIGVRRGSWEVSFIDHSSTSRVDGLASTSRHESRQISLNSDNMNWGKFDNYVVILRGFDMDLKDADTGKTGYMWPTRFKIKIENCSLSPNGKNIDCDFDIQVTREDSPDLIKSPAARISYDFQVYYTVFGGDSQDFQETFRTEYTVTNKDFEKGVRTVNRTETVHPSVDTLITGITGFEFSIRAMNSNVWRDGRYLKRYEMYVEDHPIDRSKGQKKITAHLGLLGETADAKFDATIYTVHMAFKNDPLSLARTQHVAMSVCTDIGGTSILYDLNCHGKESTSDTATIRHTISA